MNTLLGNLLSLIALTFFIAIGYGLFLTTRDFTAPNYNPIASGHRAADNIYGLFGTVSTEVRENETAPAHPAGMAR